MDHAAGKHVPTRITVTLAALKERNFETSDSDSDVSKLDDLSGDFNQFDPPDNNADPPTRIVEDRQSKTNTGRLPEVKLYRMLGLVPDLDSTIISLIWKKKIMKTMQRPRETQR